MSSRTFIDDGYYCAICQKDTKQEIHESGHERDSSGDWQRCLECGARYSGYTGKWEAAELEPEEAKKAYDSTMDTYNHIQSVQNKLSRVMLELGRRANAHDQSKLGSPEKELFDEMTPILKTLTYGSEEYKASLAKLKPALDHHYKVNSHHPEHYEDGIEGMDLLDIVEMFCDWLAATERVKDGDIRKSIEYNHLRFNMSGQLVKIFKNTIKYFEKEQKDNIS